MTVSRAETDSYKTTMFQDFSSKLIRVQFERHVTYMEPFEYEVCGDAHQVTIELHVCFTRSDKCYQVSQPAVR
jgi:hypothetical protein